MGRVHEKVFFFLIFLFALSPRLSISQDILPQEYKLLSEYLKSRDEKIGRDILKSYPDAVFLDDLKLMLSEDAYARGDLKSARDYLESINLSRLKPDLLSKYAELWKNLDLDKKKALLSAPTLFRDFIGSVDLSDDEAIGVAQKLIRHRYYYDALKVLSGVREKRSCYYVGLAYMHAGDKEKAEETFQSCDDERGKLPLVGIYIKEDREDKIRETILKLRSDPMRNSALFLVGRHYLYKGDYQKAKEYISLMTDSYEKFFNLGLVSFIVGDYEDSIHNFIRAYYFASNEGEISQSCFWVYKSYVMEGREDAGLRYLVEATKGDGFYSAVAKLKVGESVAHRVLRRVFSDSGIPLQANVIKAIRDAGFYYYSRLEAFKRIDLLSPTDIIAISRFDPFLAIRLALRKYGSRSEVYNSVAFPLPYREYVYEASERYGVSLQLVWAVMRQESLFDPFAVSSSGAKGLMQLIDSTARWMANKLGMEFQSVLDPKINVFLGTAYLKYLYEIWDGDLVKVLASYNAGENKVRSWKSYGDPYLFIETIPFKETREYVKRVLYNYYVYKDLLQ